MKVFSFQFFQFFSSLKNEDDRIDLNDENELSFDLDLLALVQSDRKQEKTTSTIQFIFFKKKTKVFLGLNFN